MNLDLSDEKFYIAIDLKSFYASVECVARGLDPLHTNLVVADESRTEKTICLAVSPSLKAYGIPGRPRLFEVVQRVEQVNRERRSRLPDGVFQGESYLEQELEQCPQKKLSYLVAPPRMALYQQFSAQIFQIYLQYIAPEDIHVYSIDEVMMDVTSYLTVYQMSPQELASEMIRRVYRETGITATAGVGTNLYLCKVAMDILAKHCPEDEHGVRIASLDEYTYRKQLWNHRPITDFWRVGSGYAKKLAECGLYTMGDVARCSLGEPNAFHNEALLYKLFGVSAELLIDHAWGYEPCTMEEIKAYRPESTSMGMGQVLQHPYTISKARLIVKEMTDMLVLDLVRKGMTTRQLVLTVGYDRESLLQNNGEYRGEVTIDRYGRRIPKHAHGTTNLKQYTSSTKQIMESVLQLYDRIVEDGLLVRRINLSANQLVSDQQAREENQYVQLDLFSLGLQGGSGEKESLRKEKQIQNAILEIQERYGKNALLKGMNLEQDATARNRNRQIGGHKA